MKHKNINIVIPSRSNSKGIINKNFKVLKKKPLLFHTLDFALKLRIKNIFISSENTKILNIIKKKYNSNKKIILDKRPMNLAQDHIHTTKVVLYVIKKYKIKNDEYIILLQPTSPFRNLLQIKSSILKYLNSKFVSIISISKANFKENNIRFIKKNKILARDISLKQRRSARSVYYVNGTFFMSKVKFLKKNKNFHNKNKSTYFVAKDKHSIDINTKKDLNLAKLII